MGVGFVGHVCFNVPIGSKVQLKVGKGQELESPSQIGDQSNVPKVSHVALHKRIRERLECNGVDHGMFMGLSPRPDRIGECLSVCRYGIICNDNRMESVVE